MKNTSTKPKINLGCFRVIVVGFALVGTFLTQHYRRENQSQKETIKGLELLNHQTDSILKAKKKKDSIQENRIPKGKPLYHNEAQLEDDSLRRLYDHEDSEYIPTEIHDTNEWDGYYN